MKQLTYKNKKYTIKVGYYALKHTKNELGGTGNFEMENILSEDITILEPLLYYSLVMGANIDNKELDLTREDMEFMLDEVMFDFIKLIPEFFPKDTETKGAKK